MEINFYNDCNQLRVSTFDNVVEHYAFRTVEYPILVDFIANFNEFCLYKFSRSTLKDIAQNINSHARKDVFIEQAGHVIELAMDCKAQYKSETILEDTKHPESSCTASFPERYSFILNLCLENEDCSSTYIGDTSKTYSQAIDELKAFF